MPPKVTLDLIDHLNEVYPKRHPSLDQSDRSIWFEAGARSVVDYLESVLQAQEEDAAARLVVAG